MNYTHETLRTAIEQHWHEDMLRAHAGAWEQDIKHSDEYARLWHRDAARIKELERENAALRANMPMSVLRRLQKQGALKEKP